MASAVHRNRQEFLDAVSSFFGPTPAKRVRQWLDERGPAAHEDLARASCEAAIVYMGEEVNRFFPGAKRDEFKWPSFLSRRDAWNPFPDNSSACSLLAVLCARLTRHEQATGAQDLAKVAVSYHLGWLDYLLNCELGSIAKALTELARLGDTERDETKRLEQQIRTVRKLAHDLVDLFAKGAGNQHVSGLADAISFIIDGFLMVREKREELHAPQVDVELPITAAWRTIYDSARSEGVSAPQKAKLDALGRQQRTLLMAAEQTQNKLVRQLEDAGKWLGRGCAVLSLIEPEAFTKRPEGPLVASRLYENHDDAPLSRLYSLRWELPEYDRARLPETRLTLLPAGTISISVAGDPSVEYFLGSWRYVDLEAKSQMLANSLTRTSRTAIRLSSYRLLRFAHQLGYHQHGATLVLHPDDAPTTGPELQKVKDEWHLSSRLGKDENGNDWPGIPLTIDLEEDRLHLSHGRLAYGLALHDGQTRWALSGDESRITVLEFRLFPHTMEDIDERIAKFQADFNLDMPRQLQTGSRHRAAFSCSLATKCVVLCVSQDGFITAFVEGVPLQVR